MRAPNPSDDAGDRLWLGAIGHRDVPDSEALRERIDGAVLWARGLVPLGGPARPLGILSALAEGADRIVAARILTDPTAVLHVPLPLPAEDYERTFRTEASRSEFRDLIARAAAVVLAPPMPTSEDAYAWAGEYVLDRSDALIAVWDGEPSRGRGGTAETLARAFERGTPVAWIRSFEPFEASYEPVSR